MAGLASYELTGRIVDVLKGAIFAGRLVVEDGRIASLTPDPAGEGGPFILPGFVDAHVHIESSMLVPSEFAPLAVAHGTVATVSDPHEIANVLGIEGVRYMIRNGRQVPFKFFFGAPSCVPATPFETAGAELTADEIETLFRGGEVGFLSEVMNYPAVLAHEGEMMRKIAIAHAHGAAVDGHAPGLRGEAMRAYAGVGITTDHECYTLPEAIEKAEAGMKILIREGSAARNFDELLPILDTHPEMAMFCSDDKHPDELVLGHIDALVRRAVAAGYDVMTVLRAACVTPVQHYGMPVGLLQPGDAADFIVVDDLTSFRVRATYLDGRQVAADGEALFPAAPIEIVNRFEAKPKCLADLAVPARGETLRVIEALDGQLVTNELHEAATLVDGYAVSDPGRDLLKITVVNRYADVAPAIGFIRNFGLKRGAIASSVAHDSHNVIAVGASDEELLAAVNALIAARGGIAVVEGERVEVLPLPVAGLMSAGDRQEVADTYVRFTRRAQELGSTLGSPYMTLSFMALLVIPTLKMSDQGLFDGQAFCFTDLFVQPSSVSVGVD